jgi:hypothetical protein
MSEDRDIHQHVHVQLEIETATIDVDTNQGHQRRDQIQAGNWQMVRAALGGNQ